MRRFLLLSAALFVLPLSACGDKVSTVGERCDDGQVCEDGLTCRLDFPGTYCAQSCSTEGEREGCKEDTICVKEFTDDFMCAPTCEEDDDCREGYLCTAVAGRTTGACRVRTQ